MTVTEAQAIEIAKSRVVSDGVMQLEGRRDVVRDEAAIWHVTFPETDLDVLGGAPHVLVEKATGSIIGVYYDQ